ncbi:MAG: protein-(glutamine-N5) methyltransferase, release factor-specific [Phycisphaerae bacterium]|nr:protein-(glutamine-N5) methyltransferase, release factor-specific [Phycisphaerae bacterium]
MIEQYNQIVHEVKPIRDDAWTTRRLLEWIERHLERQGVHNPTLVARMLLVHVVGGTDIDLYTDPERPATESERDQLRSLVSRAASHEPVQHLVGKADFFGRTFKVDGSTLIPRTATESLVQIVLDWHRGRSGISGERPDLRIADIGTGSGCIAITLARQIPGSTVVATDIVGGALELARANASDHEVKERVEFRAGSLLEPLQAGEMFDVISANLPYIPDTDWSGLDANVREHEPETALRGGADGLDLIRPLVMEVEPHMAPGGLLVLEIDPSHSLSVLEMVQKLKSVETAAIERDEFRDERLLKAIFSPSSS